MKGKIPDGPAEQSARGARQARATPLRAAYRSAPLICLAYVSFIACMVAAFLQVGERGGIVF